MLGAQQLVHRQQTPKRQVSEGAADVSQGQGVSLGQQGHVWFPPRGAHQGHEGTRQDFFVSHFPRGRHGRSLGRRWYWLQGGARRTRLVINFYYVVEGVTGMV